MNKKLFPFQCVLAAWLCAGAVPLENWRMPLYRIAVEQGECTSSPSGMFWDDMRSAYVLDSRLWPDSARYASDHWTLEPAVSLTGSTDEFLTGKNYNVHLDALSDFRWKRLTVRTALDVDQQNQDDPEYVWKKDRITAGLIEEAYLHYAGRYGFARLGRMKRSWGPFFDRSILLSNNPYSYDALEWQLTAPFLEFRHLFAAFPRLYSTRDTESGTRLDRYFSAHALNFILGKWASLGISETVIFSRENGFPDIQYVNPVSIYTVLNTNAEGNANLMVGFQGWAHPFTDKITLKGQVVFDDVQVDSKTIYDKEPMHWAGDFGITWVDPLPFFRTNHHLLFEYRYLSKWLYTVTPSNTLNGERYTYLGKGLGYGENDGDCFKAGFTAAGRGFWIASAGFTVSRKDTNSLRSPWPSESTLGYTKEVPLSRRTQATTAIAPYIEAHGYFRNSIDCHLLFESRWIRDKRISNDYMFDPVLSFTLSLHYSDFFLLFRQPEK
jgi:hypothetical protein